MASKDDEIKQVVAELDDLLSQLQANVNALTGILLPDGQDTEGASF